MLAVIVPNVNALTITEIIDFNKMDTIAYIGISHAIFIGMYYATRRPWGARNIVTIAFMSTLAILLLAMSLRPPTFPSMAALLFGLPLMCGPFLFIYTRVMISEQPRFYAHDGLHALPALLIIVLSMLLPDILRLHPVGMRPHPVQHFLGIGTIGSMLAYTVAVWILLRRHKRYLRNYFSRVDARINLNWLRWVTLAFAGAIAYVLLTGIFGAQLEHLRMPVLRHLGSHQISITGFIIVFGFLNMQQPIIYNRPPPPHSPADEDDSIEDQGSGNLTALPRNRDSGDANQRYKKSGLKSSDAVELVRSIQDYMRTERPYRESELTVLDLSRRLNIPRHHLTQVLNEQLNKNFYTLVNEYRIREVQEFMRNEAYDEHSLLRLALDAGFNSKSSFNRIFKQHTGLTPSRYRQLHLHKRAAG